MGKSFELLKNTKVGIGIGGAFIASAIVLGGFLTVKFKERKVYQKKTAETYSRQSLFSYDREYHPSFGGFDYEFVIKLPKNENFSGTVFEAHDVDGGLIFAAGFPDYMSTLGFNNSNVLNFTFGRQAGPYRRSNLGQPYESSTSLRLVSLDDRVVVYPYFMPGAAKYYDFNQRTWRAYEGLKLSQDDPVRVVQRVGGSVLKMYEHNMFIGDIQIPLDIGLKSIQTGIFHRGKIAAIIYGYSVQEKYISVWDLDLDKLAVSNRRDIVLPKETTFPYLVKGFQKSIIFGMASGDLLRLNLEDYSLSFLYRQQYGKNGVPVSGFQFYSAINYYDSLLLGHYPSGNIYVLDQEFRLSPMRPAIPAKRGTSNALREAQSLAFLGGQVVAGVWPWGEVWRGLPDGTWNILLRAFSLPAYSKERTPYYTRVVSADKKMMPNSLGQRIFNMANYGSGLVFTTAGKQQELNQAYSLLTAQEKEEYGNVVYLEGDDEINCELEVRVDSRLKLSVQNGRLSIFQDGLKKCETVLSEDGVRKLTKKGMIAFGRGLYGSANFAVTLVEVMQ